MCASKLDASIGDKRFFDTVSQPGTQFSARRPSVLLSIDGGGIICKGKAVSPAAVPLVLHTISRAALRETCGGEKSNLT